MKLSSLADNCQNAANDEEIRQNYTFISVLIE